MERKLYGLTAINEKEAVLVVGGVDKNAQQAIYYIGYAIGTAARFVVGLFNKFIGLFKKD